MTLSDRSLIISVGQGMVGNGEPVPVKNWFQIVSIHWISCQPIHDHTGASMFFRCQTHCNFQQEGVVAENKKQSKMWFHFMKKDDKSASCNICKMIIIRKGHGICGKTLFLQNMVLNSRNAMCLTLYA